MYQVHDQVQEHDKVQIHGKVQTHVQAQISAKVEIHDEPPNTGHRSKRALQEGKSEVYMDIRQNRASLPITPLCFVSCPTASFSQPSSVGWSRAWSGPAHGLQRVHA